MNYVIECLDSSKFNVYSDIPGHMIGAGSVPPEICITAQKPDIVIVDRKDKNIHIFELTVPFELNIEQRHREKSDKYAHFATECIGFNCVVTAFEIGSRGYISRRNHSALYTLHKYTKPGIKLKQFKSNISALALYSSYYIFITRNEEFFTQPPFLSPPFNNEK